MGEEEELSFEFTFNRSIKVESRGERLTGDAGVLLLRELDERLQLTSSLGESLIDSRNQELIRYSLTELLRQRLYGHAQGYRHQDDLDRTAHDPAMRLAVWEGGGERALQERLSSQPTQSRFLDTMAIKKNREELRNALSEWQERLVIASGRGHKLKVATLDVDSFPTEVFGRQVGGRYNGYYRRYMYHPLVAGLAPNGSYDDARLGEGFLHAILRSGEVHTAAGALRFIRNAVSRAKGLARTGSLYVEGAQSALTVPNRTVILAQDGNAWASVGGAAKVLCGTTEVGTQGIGEADLTISSATWTSSGGFFVGGALGTDTGPGTVILIDGIVETGDLSVYSNGTLKGTGVVLAPNSYFSGTVEPTINISPPLKTGVKQGPPPREITFAGDVEFEGARILIEISSLAEGGYGALHATGAIDIRNATVIFSFIDGFLPRMGDTVPFLTADAEVTIDNLTMEFEGAAEGFQFEVIEENGMLVFEALNDAQPLPVPDADLNGDGVVDSLDLLLFLNQWMQ